MRLLLPALVKVVALWWIDHQVLVGDLIGLNVSELLWWHITHDGCLQLLLTELVLYHVARVERTWWCWSHLHIVWLLLLLELLGVVLVAFELLLLGGLVSSLWLLRNLVH